ncbi:hypothetical protein J7438_17480 [Thalassotalea sp. G20_0]|uniref:hypothetical protein n=1 Tax=Thalassotalea sp. G20_0 TaxID=2821093 RepID=UPI001AD956EB|nr:hypothetical protein [Thalassotalea sp. G20_0]MBO9495858.1 hypothetical protein [Thalassotalea sp. G20_0]
MLRADLSSPSTMSAFTAASGNSDGFSGEKKHTQATDIKFGDTFRIISSVFSETLLKKVNKEIEDDKTYFNSDFVNRFLDTRLRVKDLNPSEIFEKIKLDNMFGNPRLFATLCFRQPIQFDKNGRLINKDAFQKVCSTTSSLALRALCSDALEKMANELQWWGRSVEVTIQLLRYPLITSKGMKGMPWHRDNYRKSMVVQLNDNTNSTGTGVKYSGGGLNIGKLGSDDEWGFKRPVEGTVENYSYGPNGTNCGNWGFIFSNYKGQMIHQAEDIVYLSENNDDLAEKRILVVFVND